MNNYLVYWTLMHNGEEMMTPVKAPSKGSALMHMEEMFSGLINIDRIVRVPFRVRGAQESSHV